MAIKKSITEFVEYLNELVQLDPVWINAVFNHRPECNVDIAAHKTVQTAITDRGPRAGVLGLLNGYFGAYETGKLDGSGALGAYYDKDTHLITHFMVLRNSTND